MGRAAFRAQDQTALHYLKVLVEMEELERVMERLREKTLLHAEQLTALGETVVGLEQLVEGRNRESQGSVVFNERGSRLSQSAESDYAGPQERELADMLAAVKGDLEAALEGARESSGEDQSPELSEASTEPRKGDSDLSFHRLSHELETAKLRIAHLEASEAALISKIATLEHTLSQSTAVSRQLSQDKTILRKESKEYEEALQTKDDLIAYLEGQICSLQSELRERSLAGEAGPSGRASYTGVIRKTIKGGKKSVEEGKRVFRLSGGGREECK